MDTEIIIDLDNDLIPDDDDYDFSILDEDLPPAPNPMDEDLEYINQILNG